MPNLLLQEAQVHTGMIVALALAENNGEPEVDEHGPLLLKALMGGVPMRKKLYALEDRPQLFQRTVEGWAAQALTDEPLNINVAGGMEGFDERVCFRPIFTFAPNDAPRNMEFVVYVGGQRLKYPSGRNNVYVRTDAQGQMLSHNGYEYDFWQRPYALPENAVLVPISRIEVTEVAHGPAVVYKGPQSEWPEIAAMLAGKVAEFGIRVVDAHANLPRHQRGPYLHLGLEGNNEETQKVVAQEIVGDHEGDFLFTTQCPYCWRTIAREHSL